MISSYKLFTTPTCPACPTVKGFMETVEIEGEHINAATPEGAKEAAKYDVRAVPTVIFFDSAKEVIAIARSIKEIKEALE
jgi:glutaredoxin